MAEGLLALVAVDRRPALARRTPARCSTRCSSGSRDGSGGFYDTADDRDDVALSALRRQQDPTDNATPAGWSAAAGALLTYAAYTGSAATGRPPRPPSASTAGSPTTRRFAGWGLAVAEALVDGPREVAVVGPAGDPATAAMHLVALRGTAPGAAVAVGDPDAAPV